MYRLPMSALAKVAGKSFNGKCRPPAKIDFPIEYFVTIADADIGSLTVSPYIWTTC